VPEPRHSGEHPSVRAPLDRQHLALDLEVPNDVNLIGRIVQMVSREVRDLDFPAHHCTLNVPVALSEALSNAMLRGNADDPGKTVHVRMAVDDRGLVLEVSDEGRGIDLERCTSDPTTADNMLREDGRGLFLMRRLMDRVERYTEAQAPRRNVVRLTLYRREASAP